MEGTGAGNDPPLVKITSRRAQFEVNDETPWEKAFAQNGLVEVVILRLPRLGYGWLWRLDCS